MNKIKISTHTPFQPLESVLVGQGVSDNFFDWIKDDKIRSPLQKIVEETSYRRARAYKNDTNYVKERHLK